MTNLISGTERKSAKLSETVTVVETGHACCRNMGWESPFMVFERGNGERVTWHSDNVETITRKLTGARFIAMMKGRQVQLTAIVRGSKVWRVQNIVDL